MDLRPYYSKTEGPKSIYDAVLDSNSYILTKKIYNFMKLLKHLD